MSLIWLASCTTTRQPESSGNNYIKVPEVYPPDPYTADGDIVMRYVQAGDTLTPDTDGVFLPYWYFEKLFDYVVDSQAALEIARTNTGEK